MSDLQSPRIQFNWGFWDGMAEAKRHYNRHPNTLRLNKHYTAGHEAGRYYWNKHKAEPNDSNEAWAEYKR